MLRDARRGMEMQQQISTFSHGGGSSEISDEKLSAGLQVWIERSHVELDERIKHEKKVLEAVRNPVHKDPFTNVVLLCGCDFNCKTIYAAPAPETIPDNFVIDE